MEIVAAAGTLCGKVRVLRRRILAGGDGVLCFGQVLLRVRYRVLAWTPGRHPYGFQDAGGQEHPGPAQEPAQSGRLRAVFRQGGVAPVRAARRHLLSGAGSELRLSEIPRGGVAAPARALL